MRLFFIGQYFINSFNEWRSKAVDYCSAKFRTSFEDGYNIIYPTSFLKSAKKRLQRSQAKMIPRPTMHPRKILIRRSPKRERRTKETNGRRADHQWLQAYTSSQFVWRMD
jgi:hypothetical protein